MVECAVASYIAHNQELDPSGAIAECYIKFRQREEQMDDPKFQVHCDASPNGQLRVKDNALSVAFSQSITRIKTQEIWQSVLILCEEDQNGTLTTKIIACHPDWQNLQVACIPSRIAGQNGTANILAMERSCPIRRTSSTAGSILLSAQI